MRKIIGIAGKARVGKDTVAKYLWTAYGYTRVAFADPLKVAAQAIFGLTSEQTWDDDLKEVPIPYWGYSPRQLFQLLGSDCVKPVFGADIWARHMHLNLLALPEDDLVIPDVRFEQEAAYIRNMGGTILHLTRPDAPAVNPHASEDGIVLRLLDVTLVNDGSLQDLYQEVDRVLRSL